MSGRARRRGVSLQPTLFMSTLLIVHNSVLYVHFGEYPSLDDAQRLFIGP